MNMHTDALTLYSDALVARAEKAAAHVIAVRHREGRHVSGLIWQTDLVVTSVAPFPLAIQTPDSFHDQVDLIVGP